MSFLSRESNPWEDNTSLGYMSFALDLAQETSPAVSLELDEESSLHKSVKSLELARELYEKRKSINELKLEIQRRHQSNECKDLFLASNREKRIKFVNDVTDHLQLIVGRDQELVSHLQKPVVNDHLRIEAKNVDATCNVFQKIISQMSRIVNDLDNVRWLQTAEVSDGSLDKCMDAAVSHSMGIKRELETLQKLRETTEHLYKIRTNDSKTTLP